jgi:hypothetical protein
MRAAGLGALSVLDRLHIFHLQLGKARLQLSADNHQ